MNPDDDGAPLIAINDTPCLVLMLGTAVRSAELSSRMVRREAPIVRFHVHKLALHGGRFWDLVKHHTALKTTTSLILNARLTKVLPFVRLPRFNSGEKSKRQERTSVMRSLVFGALNFNMLTTSPC